MGGRKFKRKRKIRGRGTPYALKNIIYFGKRAQTGKELFLKFQLTCYKMQVILLVFNEIQKIFKT